MRRRVVMGGTTPMESFTLGSGECVGVASGGRWVGGPWEGTPLYCGRKTHGPWDTTDSPFLILFSLRFIPQLRCALISVSNVHRPPVTVSDYLFVGRRDLLFSHSRFHFSFFRDIYIPLCSYCLFLFSFRKNQREHLMSLSFIKNFYIHVFVLATFY